MTDFAGFPILQLMILLPFISVIPILIFGKKHAHSVAIATWLIVLLLVIAAVWAFDSSQLLSFSLPYISYLNISLGFQVTHYNMILVLMTAIVFLAASMVGRYFIRISEVQYNIIFTIAGGSALAMFLSSNLFLFYVFWEISEVMMFFIIFIYGSYARRYAAIKFILYSLASSLLLLLAMMLIYVNVSPHTLNIFSIIQYAGTIPQSIQFAALILLLLSFIIKMPVFPFHGWLPDAHTEAPTTGSMVLAGVLLKFGGYGLILTFLMLPIATHYSKYIAILFTFSAIYAALVAFRQGNIKRAIAFTSITDMAIVAIGVAASGAIGYNGALYAMLSHGIVISLFFLIAGSLGQAYGTLEISKLKGVMKSIPSLAYLFIFGAVALVGIPLTSGFIGDLLIFIASFASFGPLGIVPLAGVVILGALMFWLVERIFLSGKPSLERQLLSSSVGICGIFLAASTVALGLLPSLLLH